MYPVMCFFCHFSIEPHNVHILNMSQTYILGTFQLQLIFAYSFIIGIKVRKFCL
jgi:hypothetical protein